MQNICLFSFKSMFLQSEMASFVSRRPQNTFLLPISMKKKKGQNFQFLTKDHGLTPLKNAKFSTLGFKLMFIQFKLASFVSVSLKNKRGLNFQFVTENHGLNRLKKCKIFDFLKSTLLQSKMASFLHIYKVRKH